LRHWHRCAKELRELPEHHVTISPTDFASLLCSRLCHDLLSPVGALNNGLELLAESARASANKLKFFRLAFGAAGGFGDTVDTREAQAAIEGLFGDNHRVSIGWMVEDPQLPKQVIKVLLNLALIGGDALVRGGQLDIGAEARDGMVEIVVRADGPRIVLDQELRGALTGDTGDAPVTPRAAAAYLVHQLVAQGGGDLQVSPPDAPVLLFGAAFKLA
jgi:histidine phosphotransferase ChpT